MSSKASLTVGAWKPQTSFAYFKPVSSGNNPQKFTYNSRHDFGRRIDTLLFSKPFDKEGTYFYKGFHNDLVQVSEIEGFTVQLANSLYTVRDAKCALGDGKTFLQLTCSSFVEKALERCGVRNAILNNHTNFLTTHPAFYRATLGIAFTNKLFYRSFDAIPENAQKNGRIYFEGGDAFYLTNTQGISKYLVGEDLLTTTHMVLRQNGWFKNPETKTTEAHVNETILYQNDTLSQKYLSGKIYEQVEKESRTILQTMTIDTFRKTFAEMAGLGLITNPSISTEQQCSQANQIVATYLAQQKIVREVVFPHDLMIAKENLVPVPQIAYHLDVLMTPGPKGSIFLQDYKESLALLRKMKEGAKELNLSQTDLKFLDSYIKNALQLVKDLNPFMEGVQKILSDAGFRVINTPGAFFSTLENNESMNANFFNAISGYSEKTEHHYYIVGGVKIGDRLGEALMDAYAAFLRNRCGSDIAVYFIGGKNYDDAMKCMNIKTANLGLHCLCAEIEVKPQTS